MVRKIVERKHSSNGLSKANANGWELDIGQGESYFSVRIITRAKFASSPLFYPLSEKRELISYPAFLYVLERQRLNHHSRIIATHPIQFDQQSQLIPWQEPSPP